MPTGVAVEVSRRVLRGSWIGLAARSRIGRLALGSLERLFAPGLAAHFARRKAWIRSRWQEARKEGFDRLIVIGAGFDTLALEAARRDVGVLSIEIDHPDTQRFKRDSIGDLPPNMRLIGADLSKRRLSDVLTRESTTAGTFVVLEGLLMYLEQAQARALLEGVARIADGRLRVVVSHMDRGRDGGIGFHRGRVLTTWWLAWKGETFRWAATTQEIVDMLGECMIPNVLAVANGKELARPWAEEGLMGEVVVLAERPV